MNLGDLEIFARVVEAKGFSAAARKLRLSKSVVSKHVSELERSIGARLLNRTTRTVSLTEVGKAFYTHCARMLDEAHQAEVVAAELQSEPRGTLRIAAPTAFGVRHLSPALAGFLAAHSGLHIDLTLDDRPIEPAEDGYDACLCMTTAPDPRLVARRIASIRKVICASPAYFARHGMPRAAEELVRHRCLVFARGAERDEWRLIAADGERSFAVNAVLRVNNENALRRAALAGLGIAMLPTFLIGEELRRGTLRAALEGYHVPESAVYLTYPPDRRTSMKLRLFIDFLTSRFAERPDWDEPVGARHAVHAPNSVVTEES